jgi:carbamate kinase
VIRSTTRDAIEADSFPAGSMSPEVAATAHFARVTGKRAAFGSLKDLPGIVQGTAGTSIMLAAGETKYYPPAS